MTYEYTIIRSRRKTITLQVDENGLTVKAPLRTTDKEISKLILAKKDWIARKLEEAERKKAECEALPKLSKEEIRDLAEKALKVIPERVKYYAPLVGVTYGRITIRNQRSRWGSCSAKGNLNFTAFLC